MTETLNYAGPLPVPATADDYTIRIEQDIDPMNPRTDFDHGATMVCFHGRYGMGDTDHGYSEGDFGSWAELRAQLVKDGARVILPLYLIDHSGISMRAGRDFGDCDPGGWDSGQVGFIFATSAQIREWFGVKKITKAVEARAVEGLLAEVEEYDQYLTGDVWGYVIEDMDGDVVESCWGFYGSDYCETEAASVVKYLVEGQ